MGHIMKIKIQVLCTEYILHVLNIAMAENGTYFSFV
jgi:hypothetical protein